MADQFWRPIIDRHDHKNFFVFSATTVDFYKIYLYTYGLDDPGYSRTPISRIKYVGEKNGKFVKEYNTNEKDLKHGFLFLVINKYNGDVEFEAK